MSLLISFVVLGVCVALARRRQRRAAGLFRSLRHHDRLEQGKGIDQICWNWDVMRNRQ